MTSKRLRIRFSVIEDHCCDAHVKDIDREYAVETQREARAAIGEDMP